MLRLLHPGTGSLLEEDHAAQRGVGGHKEVQHPIAQLGRQEPEKVAQAEQEEGLPYPPGTLQAPAEGLPQGVLRMGAQAVAHRQKDAVQPEGKQSRRHGQDRCSHLQQGAGGGVGLDRRGGSVEQVE